MAIPEIDLRTFAAAAAACIGWCLVELSSSRFRLVNMSGKRAGELVIGQPLSSAFEGWRLLYSSDWRNGALEH